MQGIETVIVGNVTADPDTRTVNGSTVANFDVAVNHGYKDRDTGEWKDTGTSFVRVACWRELGEHVGESVRKGVEVIVTGRLETDHYETKEGQPRTALVLNAQEVGVSLRWATATVTKAQRVERPPFIEPRGAHAAPDPLTAGMPF